MGVLLTQLAEDLIIAYKIAHLLTPHWTISPPKIKIKFTWKILKTRYWPTLIPLSRLCGSRRGSLRFYKYFCQQKAAVVLRKVAEGLRFDCGSFTVLSIYLGFPSILCRYRTAENRGLNGQLHEWESGMRMLISDKLYSPVPEKSACTCVSLCPRYTGVP